MSKELAIQDVLQWYRLGHIDKRQYQLLQKKIMFSAMYLEAEEEASQIVGPYQLLDCIAEKESGRVFRTRFKVTQSNQFIGGFASLIVHPHLLTANVIRKIEFIRLLQVPHFIRIYDFIRDPVPMIIFDHIPGIPLHQMVGQDFSVASTMLLDVARTIDDLHREAFVHHQIEIESILWWQGGAFISNLGLLRSDCDTLQRYKIPTWLPTKVLHGPDFLIDYQAFAKVAKSLLCTTNVSKSHIQRLVQLIDVFHLTPTSFDSCSSFVEHLIRFKAELDVEHKQQREKDVYLQLASYRLDSYEADSWEVFERQIEDEIHRSSNQNFVLPLHVLSKSVGAEQRNQERVRQINESQNPDFVSWVSNNYTFCVVYTGAWSQIVRNIEKKLIDFLQSLGISGVLHERLSGLDRYGFFLHVNQLTLLPIIAESLHLDFITPQKIVDSRVTFIAKDKMYRLNREGTLRIFPAKISIDQDWFWNLLL